MEASASIACAEDVVVVWWRGCGVWSRWDGDGEVEVEVEVVREQVVHVNDAECGDVGCGVGVSGVWGCGMWSGCEWSVGVGGVWV